MQSFETKILNRFNDVVKRHQNNNAFIIKDSNYTYREFYNLICSIQNSIMREKQSSNSLVCLVCNDDIYTYASIWALWFLGKGYVPLHPEQPIDRNLNIIKQVEADLILDSENNHSYPDIQVLNTSSCSTKENNLAITTVSVDDTYTAYILFTSGSTGSPKGVEISRKNIASFVESIELCGYKITPSDKCLQYFDLTFDVSVQSFILPLLNGASVYTIPVGALRATYAINLIQTHQLTCASIAPSLIRLFRPYLNEINAKSLRLCIVTAEASYKSLIEEWGACACNATIFDFYGPTECTIYCTYYKCPNNLKLIKHHNDCLSIGKTMPGVIGIIIDEKGNTLPNGEIGELCIAGDQVSTGYWKNPEKNTEAFFNMEFLGKDQRFYHTGDSCYIDKDGDIMYLGRIDFQAKIQGYRVELGEIEYHIKQFLKKEAIVLAIKSENGDDELYTFIQSSNPIDKTNLINYLKSKMPSYMVPMKYIIITDFPLNANGKIDRKQLNNLIKQ